ncbi:hypothetical protein [Cetobacterium sp.]|uniref:hypothetical protein n=1 Tax=Cetobacterium sp. TaxID=2071632 RepID=UPI003EE5530D
MKIYNDNYISAEEWSKKSLEEVFKPNVTEVVCCNCGYPTRIYNETLGERNFEILYSMYEKIFKSVAESEISEVQRVRLMKQIQNILNEEKYKNFKVIK